MSIPGGSGHMHEQSGVPLFVIEHDSRRNPQEFHMS